MEQAKWNTLAKGAGLAVVYCLAYLAAWFNSLDQWFLPAGVRIAAFLLLPYRYWPYLLAGDCAALLLLRVPLAFEFGSMWVYASSALLPLTVALPLVGVRARFKSLADQAKWLPLIAACMAIWGSLSNSALNGLLDGPPSGTTLEFVYRRCVGQFLAILAITLPVMLWLLRKDRTARPGHFVRDAIVATAAILAVFFSIVLYPGIGDYQRIGLMLMMLVPTSFMTLRHGWRGAALGITASCFAIAKTLHAFNAEGAYDAPVFIVQHAFVIASCGLLALGHAISTHYAAARWLGIGETEALRAARGSFLAMERALKERALTLEALHRQVDDERKRVVEHLKAFGDLQGALLLNTQAVQQTARFSVQLMDVYPLRLEAQGLNAVLNSQEFIDSRGGGADILPLLGSNPKLLSLELQQVAYRCACNALDLLSELQPDVYVIKTRIRKSARLQGIVLIASVRNAGDLRSTPKSANAALELDARVKAHGGIVKRRHAHRISLWLSEPFPVTGSDQSEFPGLRISG